MDKNNFKSIKNIDEQGCSVTEYSKLLNLLNNIKIKV
jgi:hypothetical protein